MAKNLAERKQSFEPLRLIEQKRELIPIDNIDSIPKGLRGIYVLYRTVESGKPKIPHRHVVYVGMSASGMKGRLRAHRKHKRELWDSCSIFVVWPNVREDEIRELEGILRHIYRFDPNAQQLNAQGRYIKLTKTLNVELDDSYRKQVEYLECDAADAT
ncbi:GIY-YIG nuclease family protein [Burkholderia ubonensis]|nr:GIY-YIG nuclease family protein [Burkholderia ubonensis]KVD07862.1 hypothetical protein WI79_08600 [Burkholderia ubonensis]KWI32841.1 hypothetical protein WM04_12225 [Burkholderia ubonensis]OJB19338.1 hypothetical protein BGV53_07820 [Burkholderia ubonensis]